MTPLRRRLFLLATASVVPLAALAAFGIRVLMTQHRQEVQRIGLELSRSIANAVDGELKIVVVSLNTASTASTLQRGDFAAFQERLGLLLRQQPGWYGVSLTTPDGMPLIDTRAPAGTGSDIDTAGIRRTADTGRPVVGALARDAQNRWYFPVHVPVVESGHVRYVLSALVSPTVVRDAVARQRVPDDWVISILDSNNLRIARSRSHEENLGGRLSPSAERVLDGGQPEGFGISDSLEGERIYTPYSRLPDGWAAVLGLPTAQGDAALQQAIAVYGGGLLLSIGLGLLGAAWVGRTISRPTAALRDAAVAVGTRGAPRLPATSIREINEVGTALVAAADELRRSDHERELALARERSAREAAEAADRSKDEFLGILSHELRTPLNAVYGWGRMLQNGQLKDDAAATRARDAIVRNAGIQIQMIDDLLDLSRIASGRMRIEMADVDLPRVLTAAIESVRPAAAAKQIAIVADARVPSAAVSGDAGRLQQVFWNLLNNAVRFTPAGGRIDVVLAGGPLEWQVLIRDTGEGIDAATLPHIFDRFRQADSSITRRHGGLGLGLSLVKHLTEIHGGRVVAASAGGGQGATFTVTLPARTSSQAHTIESASPPEGPTAAASTLTRLDSLHVVLVEDDPEGMQLTKTVLKQAGAEVTGASSAEEGFALVRRLRPDVLISDVGMPGEDGYSLIRRIRALSDDDGGDTPAIALTAYGRSQDHALAITAGYNVHITKPMDPASLTSTVKMLSRRVVDGKPA